jgi:hypothetical protein
MSITSKFIKAFDPKSEVHVKWLSEMNDMAEKMGDPKAPISLVEKVNTNPMNMKLEQRDALDWPNVHFVLLAAYAKAVMKGKAFIPTQKVR